jgi:predicted PurR-regulated permease PerM
MALGSTVLFVGLMYWAQKILIPLALAVLLTFILTPLVAALQKRGLPRSAAVTVTVLLALGLLGATGWIVTLQLRQLADELPQHTHTISSKLHDLQGSEDSVLAKLRWMGDEIVRELRQPPMTATVGSDAKPMPVVIQDPKPFFLAVFPSVAGPAAEFLASSVLVVMLVVFMLIRHEDLRFRLIQLTGRGRLTVTTRALDEAAERISAFLGMQLTVNTGFGLFLFAGLALVGIPFAFLRGFLSALLRFIPYLGTWVALVFPLTLAFAVFPDWYPPLEVLCLFLALELVTANVVEPMLFSHSTGISPVALLLATAFWTWLWGAVGLLLATPMTVSLFVLGRHVPHLQIFDTLLGSEPVMETDMRFYQRLLAEDEDEATELVERYLETRPAEDLYDEVLMPALVRMKRDQERGDLPADEQHFVLRAVHDILDDLELPADELLAEDAPLVIACPARDEMDELALHMLGQLLKRRKCRVEVLSTVKLSAEMVHHVAEKKPALVCIGSLTPSGMAQLRYMGKRLRISIPELKILALRWGPIGNLERVRQRLRTAGVDYVALTLREAQNLALSLVFLEPRAPRERQKCATLP